MHPEVTSDKPGKCPKCGGMELVKYESGNINHGEKIENSYWPLIVIIGMITLVTAVLGYKDYQSLIFNLQSMMSYFMAGFFLVFSGFKFLDLKGFASGYSSYFTSPKSL